MNYPANQKTRVLWIEDGARVEIPQLAVPLYMKSEYYLVITDNVTDADHELTTQRFDVVIFDLRLPPGTDERFRALSKTLTSEKKAQRLGLYLLLSYFGTNDFARGLKTTKPDWLSIEQVAILSVDPFIDPEVHEALNSINFPVDRYKHKTAAMGRTTLLELVIQVINQNVH